MAKDTISEKKLIKYSTDTYINIYNNIITYYINWEKSSISNADHNHSCRATGPVEKQDLLELYSMYGNQKHISLLLEHTDSLGSSLLPELNKRQEWSSQTTLKDSSVSECYAKMIFTSFLDNTSLLEMTY